GQALGDRGVCPLPADGLVRDCAAIRILRRQGWGRHRVDAEIEGSHHYARVQAQRRVHDTARISWRLFQRSVLLPERARNRQEPELRDLRVYLRLHDEGAIGTGYQHYSLRRGDRPPRRPDAHPSGDAQRPPAFLDDAALLRAQDELQPTVD